MAISSLLASSMGGSAATAGSVAQKSKSSFAEIFSNAKAATSPESSAATTGATAGELTREAENQLSEFKRAMKQLLSEAGIDDTWAISLQSNGAGGVTVDPSHPDHEKITELLQQNPDLIERFNQLQKAYEKLRTSTGEMKPGDKMLQPVFSVVFAEDSARVEFE